MIGGAAFRRVAPRVRRVLVISVDGQATTDPTLGRQRAVSGVFRVFSAVSGAQIDAFNVETMLLAEQTVGALVERIKEARREAGVAGGCCGRGGASVAGGCGGCGGAGAAAGDPDGADDRGCGCGWACGGGGAGGYGECQAIRAMMDR